MSSMAATQHIGGGAAAVLLAALLLSSAGFPSTCLADGEQCGEEAGGAKCSNNLCCSRVGFCGSTDAYCLYDNGCQIDYGVCHGVDVSSIITRAIFDQFLPLRNSSPANGFYSHDAFLAAAALYDGFGTGTGTGTGGGFDVQKRELAAFFANIAHETSCM